VIEAAKAGKHIMCEKPMALSLEEADSMVAAAKEAGVKFMVGHCIRFWAEYQVLKEYVDEGHLGKLKSLWFSRLSPTPTWSWNNWLMDEKKSAGALLDLHIHDTDYIIYLLGKPSAVLSRGFKMQGGWGHVLTDYEYEDIAVFAEGSWAMPSKFPFSMSYRAVFEKGVMDFNSARTPTLLIYEGNNEPYTPELPKPDVGDVDAGGNISDLGGYYNELAYYIDCLMKDEYPQIVTPESARDSVALILAEMKSLETGEMVSI
jgi:predicted dehydrogenase